MAAPTLPEPTPEILEKALAVAAASARDPNSTIRAALEEQALALWAAAHAARRAAMYGKGARS